MTPTPPERKSDGQRTPAEVTRPGPRELGRETLASGRRFDFELVRLRGDGGELVEREMLRHPGAVTIVPILDRTPGAERFAMVRNHRFAVGRDLLEFPAGKLEPGENPVSCAVRELKEETGHDAGGITPLGWFYTTPGITDEVMHVFAATDLSFIGTAHEENEWIEPVEMAASELWARAGTPDLPDGKTISSLLLAARAGLVRWPG